MEVEDKSSPTGKVAYQSPTLNEIYSKIDEMNSEIKPMLRVGLSDEKNEFLCIVLSDIYVCFYESENGKLYLTADEISDNETFYSYDEFTFKVDYSIPKDGAKGAVYRFNKYNGIDECICWRQDTDDFERA